jgi:hypothetical protein
VSTFGNNIPTVSYTRGHDLSGSLEGAGGIGGLLARSHGYSGGSWDTHNCYHADGGGNITYLMTGAQGLAARSGGRLACRKAGPLARRQGPVDEQAGAIRAAGCRPLRQPGRLPLRDLYGRLLSSSGSLAAANL